MATRVETGSPVLLSGDTQSFQQLRQLTQILTDGVGGRDDFKVYQWGTGTLYGVGVKPGYLWVRGTTDTGAMGQYLFGVTNTIDQNVGLLTPSQLTTNQTPATGTRIDSVYVKVYDHSEVPGEPDVRAELGFYKNPVVDGNPPDLTAALGATVYRLANISASAGQLKLLDANITDTRKIAGFHMHGENGTNYRLGVDATGELGFEAHTY